MQSLEAQRRQRLPQLAGQCSLAARIQILGELLGDGAAALHDLAAFDVGEKSARESAGVDAGVPVETAVLDRDDRVEQVLRQVVNRHSEPLLPHASG